MDNYMFYSICFFFILIATVLILTRHLWQPHVPALALPFNIPLTIPQIRRPQYTRVPSSFSADAASGLHSSTFDLSGNIESGDARAGLDERGKQEVQRLMKTRRIDFDEARRLVVMERFRREGIGEDGIPKDAKFVSFS